MLNVSYMPQSSILRYFLSLIYINDLHAGIKYSKVPHFTDGTNFLIFNSCVKSVNVIYQNANFDFKNLSNWLRFNKISLIIDINDLLFLTSPQKLEEKLKIIQKRKKIL